MTSLSANNPFQLQPGYAPGKTTQTRKPKKSSGSSFQASKLAQINGRKILQQDTFESSQNLLNTQDTQANLLQSLSTPARKRDALPLAAQLNYPSTPVYSKPSPLQYTDNEVIFDDTGSLVNSSSQTDWLSGVKNQIMDLFFEPLPPSASDAKTNPTTVTAVAQNTSASFETERPIGIAQLTRFTFATQPASTSSIIPATKGKRQNYY